MTLEAGSVGGKGAEHREKASRIRRVMARRMVESVTSVPQFHLRLRVDLTSVVARRQALRDEGRPTPSVNDYVVAACGRALREHPGVNATWDDGDIVQYERVNVGVAMAVPGGLLVPSVYDADRKTVEEIAADTRELVQRGASGRFSVAELSDPTFTVSNLGMFGIEGFDAIVSPPQAAILSVGAMARDGRPLVELGLGCDHRALTGAEGAAFLSTLRDSVER